jgi:hypothetical protein
MRTFHWVSGELTEVQRFINVPMRWCEQYPARERRELWIFGGHCVDTFPAGRSVAPPGSLARRAGRRIGPSFFLAAARMTAKNRRRRLHPSS